MLVLVGFVLLLVEKGGFVNEQGWSDVVVPSGGARSGVAGDKDANGCSLATAKPHGFKQLTVVASDVFTPGELGALLRCQAEVVGTSPVEFPSRSVLLVHHSG